VTHPIDRRAPALLGLLLLAPPVAAQSLGEAAARERQRRESAVAAPSKVLTNDDLEKHSEHPVPEGAAAPTLEPSEPAANPLRQGTHWRRLASAETYLKQCESRSIAARQRWMAAVEAQDRRQVEEARRAVMAADQALERARSYRDEAEKAARRAGGLAPVE
jgi:hypothetical protein